jgi:hypothetical protein
MGSRLRLEYKVAIVTGAGSSAPGIGNITPETASLHALYRCFAKSLNFIRHILVEHASRKSPPQPP